MVSDSSKKEIWCCDRPYGHEGCPCKGIINALIDYVDNILVINVLHASTVGAGFIPALPATDEN